MKLLCTWFLFSMVASAAERSNLVTDKVCGKQDESSEICLATGKASKLFYIVWKDTKKGKSSYFPVLKAPAEKDDPKIYEGYEVLDDLRNNDTYEGLYRLTLKPDGDASLEMLDDGKLLRKRNFKMTEPKE